MALHCSSFFFRLLVAGVGSGWIGYTTKSRLGGNLLLTYLMSSWCFNKWGEICFI